ncbi:MAG: ABC transporter permease, partial [Thermodesulfobacteriota bacterium]
ATLRFDPSSLISVTTSSSKIPPPLSEGPFLLRRPQPPDASPFEPYPFFFRALPPIALIPLMIIFFGIGETSKVVVLTYASFFPALVVIYQALVGLDPIYIRAARALGANNLEIFSKVILPQLVPHIITACRVSLGVCWATLVAAELIAAQKGIGAMMVDAQNFFQMAPLVLGIILIGAISLAMDGFVRWIERRVTGWQEKLA